MKTKILLLILFLLSSVVQAGTAIAPSHRMDIWQGPNAMPDSYYTTGYTSAMGTLKILKSSWLTTLNLSSALDLARSPGAYLSAKSFNGQSHQSVTDNYGAYGQCVAFARSMTGANKSTTWKRGLSLQNFVYWDGRGYRLRYVYGANALQTGTMIAHFQGRDMYPLGQPYGHVAIFASWSYNAAGYIDGINVIDQNLVDIVNIGGINKSGASGIIMKHKLPWACTAGGACGNSMYLSTFFSSNYHVVDVQ